MHRGSAKLLGPVLAVALGLACPVEPASAQQTAPVKLFKVITAKDEVEIGLTDDELRSFGPLPDIENLARRLVDAGQLTVGQYAVKRAGDGGTVHAPLRRIAIFKADTLRIEPFNPAPLKAVAPEASQ